jgi:hypothetical protein
MTTYSYSEGSFGSRFAESVEAVVDVVEAEVRHAVAYLDAEVVPQVRRESAGAMRHLAGHLERLAKVLDPERKQGL